MPFQINNRTFPDALPELHTHVRSDKDAFIFPDKLTKRMNEMGMPGLAVTDHGVLSSIEDYRHAFDSDKEHPLKLIPGVEMYVENEISGRDHAILLAIDDKGYHGISKIVTESNRHIESGYPTVTASLLCEMAEKYKGHIIFMTACMQGVVCSVFLKNDKIEKLIAKAVAKRDKYFSGDSDEYLDALQETEEADAKITSLRLKRDEAKRTAEQKFVTREKKIDKLTGAEKETAEKLLKEDKEKAQTAARELPKIQTDLKKAQAVRTKCNKTLKNLKASVDKYNEYDHQIADLRSQVADDDSLMREAEAVLDRYVKAFGKENVYCEIQYHGIPTEKVCFTKVVKLAEKKDIGLVATNDVHMLTNTREDLVRRSILRSMRFQQKFEGWTDSDKELYLKTTEERYAILSQIFDDETIIKAFDGIEEVYNRCNVEFKVKEHYPVASADPKKDLEALIDKGIKRRFPNGFPDKEVYEERLAKEIDTIECMGYDNYHLVVREFLNYGELLGKVPKEKISEAPLDTEELRQWIKDNGWEKNAGYRIGTGRGSDGGSLVCYLLGITNLDPIVHNLLFERFLNRERVSMPDIDSDISADTRQKVIDHCKYVYGGKAVCGIINYTFLASKGAINCAAKYYSMYKFGESENHFYKLGQQIASFVPDGPNVSFSTTVDPMTGKPSSDDKSVPLKDYLLNEEKDNPDALAILDWAFIMEGAFTGYGTHAAGIVITEKGSDVSDVLPLKYNDKIGMMTTQCAKDDVEANGLLKFDFLGLQTLDIITETLFMIQEKTGKAIDVLKLDIADKNVYEKIFATGNTGAVFQFESDGMKKMLRSFKPSCFADLVLLVAAYRPGPMQFLDDIIAVKNGRKEVSYLDPQLEHILSDTYGAIVYQEQVMQICRDLAGYSLGGADIVRRAMSKKKKEKLEHERDAFIHGDKDRNIAGCVANGVPEAVATKIFDQMMDFASYAFNKSHAAAYAYNSYITAWLKCYYPAEFFAAAMNWADNDKHPLSELIKEARAFGVEILPPDINASEHDFTVEEGKIRFALSKIKGVKDNCTALIAERKHNGPFESYSDVLTRTKTKSNIIKALVLSGTFDKMGKSRTGLIEVTDRLKELAKKLSEKNDVIMASDTILGSLHDGITKDDVIELQKSAGTRQIYDTVPSAGELEEKKRRAFSVVSAIKTEMTSLEESVSSEEDRKERLEEEKEYLGAYISDTPIAGYPSNDELGVAPIQDMDEGTTKVFGYIEDIRIVKRKSDGAPMAVFTVSDDAATVSAVCFAEKYAELKDRLTAGSVYIFYGSVRKGNEGYSFTVKRLSTPKAINGNVYLDPGSIHKFHLDEECFRKKYEQKNGFKFYLYDRQTDKFREAGYRVTDEVTDNRQYRAVRI